MIVYKNARIFKNKLEVIENGFIEVEDGIIKKVADMKYYNLKNAYLEVFDFKDLKIYPGFIDSHTHLGMWETGLGFEGDDGNEETDPITPHFRAIDGCNSSDVAFFDALKSGITTVVTGPGSSNPIGGSFVALKTFGSCVDDNIVKNPVGIKFALGENPKKTYNEKEMTPTTRMGIAALIREQLEKTKVYMEKRKKREKPDFDAKCEALICVLERKAKAFFHCHRTDDIFTAIRISKEYNLDFTLVHATEGYLIPKRYLKDLNIIVGPLITDISKPELKNMSDSNCFSLFKKGANVSICTDSPVFPIQYLALSCSVAIKNGLSKDQAVCAITENAARNCNIYDVVGSIEEKKIANFVVFEKESDIFSIYSKPKFVIIDGKIVFSSKVSFSENFEENVDLWPDVF